MSRFHPTVAVPCVLAALLLADVAGACLMADRLRVVAPYLSEAEVQALAHGNMHPELIPYHLDAATTCNGGSADIFSCDHVDLLAFLPLSAIGGGTGNDMWGWKDPLTGTEYALIGRSSGLSFIDLSDPENPVYVGNLPSHASSTTWRDVKVFQDHAFVVSDNNPTHGLQVFDLTQLRSVGLPPVTFTETAFYNGTAQHPINDAHNIVIDEATGFAYIVGTHNGSACGGGLYMVDINDPESPQYAGCFSADGYTHDAECLIYSGPDTEHAGREICFASNEDTLTIVDVTDKLNPMQLSRTGYPQSGYTHQGWLTEDQRYFVHDDELDEIELGHTTRTYTWDVADLDDPVLTGHWDAAGSSIDHNQYIKGQYTYQANYRRGLRILKLVDPSTASFEEVAFFDTYPEADGNGFSGAWSTYPFFDSGVVLVSDINRGLFVLRPVLPEIFDDGFESGDTSGWGMQVPTF
jgi:choice-of-anchor B domain-containing protein